MGPINLSMPFGIPSDVSTLVDHYESLTAETTIEKQSDNSVYIWITNNDLFTGLHCMTRSLIQLIPAGGTSPEEVGLSEPALVAKVWLWDYIAMSDTNRRGSILPKLIFYGNLDITEVREAVQLELASNPRYGSLSTTEKTDLEDAFLAGEARLLAASEMYLGRGLVEDSGEYVGKLKTELVFFDEANSRLVPEEVIEIFRIIGGNKMNEHPLMDALAKPVTPGVAPLEGGTRVKIIGSGFTSATTVTIGGNRATDMRVSGDGNTLFVTLPASMSPGTFDVGIDTPSVAPTVHGNAITYVEDIVETARAVTSSYLIHLFDIQSYLDELAASGDLSDEEKIEISLELDVARYAYNDIIYARSAAGGGSLGHPEVEQAWLNVNQLLRSTKESIYLQITMPV